MSVPNYLTSPRTALAIARAKKHIFFVSHMRAYSSLFGHIMGSHPKICGYYEMHIGYHSYKSLTRQKMLFFREEVAKPGFQFMFDKVLHDDHFLAPNILNASQTRTIFALRHPQKTIPSIMRLYAGEDPSHPFNNEAFATRYYIDRARSIHAMAADMARPYFYLDAETITNRTQDALRLLSDWLNLEPELDSNYSVQKKTSQSRYGDTSDRLKSGKIEQSAEAPQPQSMDPELLDAAVDAYEQSRQGLIECSAQNCLIAL